jgi:hypothetical protein
MARRDANGVRLYTRNGNDFSKRFPLVLAAIAVLPTRSCLIDGEAIVSDASGLAVFDLIRSWPTNLSAVLCAFDLLELDGEDLRRLPIEARKAGLVQLLRKPSSGIALNEHFVGDGEIVYRQACKFGCEGIVSKRLARPTAPADRSTGSKSRIRRPRQCGARRRKIGAGVGAGRTRMSLPFEGDDWLPGFNFNVEEWFEGDTYETLAICRTFAVARAAFDAAVAEKPAGRFTIRQRTRVVKRHPQGNW